MRISSCRYPKQRFGSPYGGSNVPMEYMLVKEPSDTEWQRLVMGSIEGFEYVQGHAYELKVRKTTLANPPQDGMNCTYRLIEILSDTQPDTPVTPEEWPEEAKFKLKMVQLTPFMYLDTPLAAPFDLLTFRILDHRDEYTPFGNPEFLQYYDSIVMSSPVMPDTYPILQRKKVIVERLKATHHNGARIFSRKAIS